MKKRGWIIATVTALSMVSATTTAAFAANNEGNHPGGTNQQERMEMSQPDPFQANGDIQELKKQIQALKEQDKQLKGQFKDKRQQFKALRQDLKTQWQKYKTARQNKDANTAKEALTKIVSDKKELFEMKQKLANALQKVQ